MYPKDPAAETAQQEQQEQHTMQMQDAEPVQETPASQEPQDWQTHDVSDTVVPPAQKQDTVVYGEVPEAHRAVSHPFAVLSTWSYVWSFLLLGIPVVGLITAIVWACGGAHSQNRRHMGRAYLILFACGILLALGISIGLLVQLYSNGMLYPWLY